MGDDYESILAISQTEEGTIYAVRDLSGRWRRGLRTDGTIAAPSRDPNAMPLPRAVARYRRKTWW